MCCWSLLNLSDRFFVFSADVRKLKKLGLPGSSGTQDICLVNKIRKTVGESCVVAHGTYVHFFSKSTREKTLLSLVTFENTPIYLGFDIIYHNYVSSWMKEENL